MKELLVELAQKYKASGEKFLEDINHRIDESAPSAKIKTILDVANAISVARKIHRQDSRQTLMKIKLLRFWITTNRCLAAHQSSKET